MDDIGPLPLDSQNIEVWIQRKMTENSPPSFIADELLKRWSTGQLADSGKQSVGRYCLDHSFISAVTRVLISDLKNNIPLPWPITLEILGKNNVKFNQELNDALLTGCSLHSQILPTAAVALNLKLQDPRWQKVFNAEVKEQLEKLKPNRNKLFEEIKILQREGMISEARQALEKILTHFPDDKQARDLARQLDEQSLDRSLETLRRVYQNKQDVHTNKTQPVSWPELQNAVEKVSKDLSHDDAYHLAIALYQMDLFETALIVLRSQKSKWGLKEHLFEIELCVNQNNFAEALELSQDIIKTYPEDSGVINEAMYFSAKSYYGLADTEQAVSILRGLVKYHPHYRDASILIVEWENSLS